LNVGVRDGLGGILPNTAPLLDQVEHGEILSLLADMAWTDKSRPSDM
jgi:hypothetical protein